MRTIAYWLLLTCKIGGILLQSARMGKVIDMAAILAWKSSVVPVSYDIQPECTTGASFIKVCFELELKQDLRMTSSEGVRLVISP